MQNCYQILGLANFADHTAVKNAFRRLAKLYHPDINPVGQEHFKNIVKAYEILSDPYQKSQYDYKLKSQLNQAYSKALDPKKKAAEKSGDVSDRELKRRQYYQEHYKNQQSKYVQDEPETGRMSNEFRNILFATPLAVLLIMLLLNVWSDKPQIKVVPYKEEVKKPLTADVIQRKRVVTGDQPYMEYFGGSAQDTIQKRELTVKNLTGNDILVFLFTKKQFIRSCYIEHGFEVDFNLLPKELSSVRVMQGRNFEYIKELPKAGVFGAFTEDLKFYYYRHKLKLDGNNKLTLINMLDQGFELGKEDDFFKKENALE